MRTIYRTTRLASTGYRYPAVDAFTRDGSLDATHRQPERAAADKTSTDDADEESSAGGAAETPSAGGAADRSGVDADAALPPTGAVTPALASSLI